MAQVSMKILAKNDYQSFSVFLKQPALYATAIFYSISIFTWFLALKLLPLSLAYPLQALGYVIVTLLAWSIFSEPTSPVQILALSMIVLGVVLLSLSSGK